ncbi:MAG: hypothetical protein ABI446_12895 [Gemmatimonadaceae bacterium]
MGAAALAKGTEGAAGAAAVAFASVALHSFESTAELAPASAYGVSLAGGSDMLRTSSRFALSVFAAALLASSLSACGSDLLGVDQQWDLQTAEGAALPFTVPDATHDVILTSAVASLHSDNTYTTTFTGTVDGVSGQIGQDRGHWAIGGSIFTFQSTTLGADYVAALVNTHFNASVPGQLVMSTDANFDMTFAH